MNKQVLIFFPSFIIMFPIIVVGLIPELEENLFRSINVEVQDVTNKIFNILQLSKNYAEKYETRLRLSLHASLKNASENQYKINENISKICKVDVEYKVQARKSLFVLDDTLAELMKEDTDMYRCGQKSADMLSEAESIEIPENYVEAKTALRDYLRNVENIDLADIEKPFKKISQIYEKHKQLHHASRRNFKVWKPENLNELQNARRIFNGRHEEVVRFSFIASVHVNDKFVCTGSIISKDLIITAASCLQILHYKPDFLRYYPNAIAVRVGSNYPDRGGDLITVSSVKINSLYQPSNLRNNLAIIRMKKHLHIGRRNTMMRRIEYQRSPVGNLPKAVTVVQLLGWGNKDAASPDVEEDNHLSFTYLNITRLQDCKETYTTAYVTEKNFCAGIARRGAGACQRDIGGPAIYGAKLVGIVSFTPPVCGITGAPTVFTNIGYHMKWITSIVNATNARRHFFPYNARRQENALDLQIENLESNTTLDKASNNTKLATNTQRTDKKNISNEINLILKNMDDAEYTNAMHLLSYAVNQIMENSYEFPYDDFTTQLQVLQSVTVGLRKSGQSNEPAPSSIPSTTPKKQKENNSSTTSGDNDKNQVARINCTEKTETLYKSNEDDGLSVEILNFSTTTGPRSNILNLFRDVTPSPNLYRNLLSNPSKKLSILKEPFMMKKLLRNGYSPMVSNENWKKQISSTTSDFSANDIPKEQILSMINIFSDHQPTDEQQTHPLARDFAKPQFTEKELQKTPKDSNVLAVQLLKQLIPEAKMFKFVVKNNKNHSNSEVKTADEKVQKLRFEVKSNNETQTKQQSMTTKSTELSSTTVKEEKKIHKDNQKKSERSDNDFSDEYYIGLGLDKKDALEGTAAPPAESSKQELEYIDLT